jgi:glycosyltransferase involved in cell wall biosynthesis
MTMKTTQEPLVSIVTPVYNGEAYLAKCVNGVIQQTYRNWEYIIVNNCSTDRSLEIANEFASADSRVRVVSRDTYLDQIANINYAVTLISPKAKYCKVAFADDLLFPACVEEMVKVAELDSDIAMVGCHVSNGISVAGKAVPLGRNIISGKEACRPYLLHGISLFSSLNALLVRADVVRRRNPFHSYNDGFFEDTDLCFDILKFGKFGFVHQILAFNRRDNSGRLSETETLAPFLVTDLLFLHRHGPHYLTSQEFEKRWNEKATEYVRFLAKSALLGREAAFWDFHHKGMAQMEFSFSKTCLAWNVFLILLDYALNPKSSIEKAIARLPRMHRTNSLSRRVEDGGAS